MRNVEALEQLISERWPKLRKRAQSENDPEKLIAVIEDIDDLLFILEMRVTALKTEKAPSTTESPLESAYLKAKSIHS